MNASPKSFAETALELGGKSAEEARRTGDIDRADDQVEHLFAAQYQTQHSPLHRAVWERGVPVELFGANPRETPAAAQAVMDRSYEIVLHASQQGRLYNAQGKLSDELLRELGVAGYWGLLIDAEYGGTAAPFRSFAPFLTRMATLEPSIAGLASVHGCIGAVDPLRTFGTAEQKRRLLPPLASGERLSAFALTEPCAGSDLTALRTTAVREGNAYYVSGEKLFITNAVPGRTLGLVCLVEGAPAVLVCELPPQETEQFQLKRYGLHAVRHLENNGLLFQRFRVPAENLLQVQRGNGLTIAYHGLNLGRVALCANAAGVMRQLLASMLPWAHYRQTYGEPIARRELVRQRLARLASLIVGADALVNWCASLLDAGYRGEMECIIAKIFGSNALQEAATELCLRTHGGRSFLAGHIVGDHLHEYLAPGIYEGEGEMLALALFKSLVKQHGQTYFEPVGRALAEAGIKRLNPYSPRHLWALRNAAWPYAKWSLGRALRPVGRSNVSGVAGPLRAYAAFACEGLQRMAMEISAACRKHQLKLADRQCRMGELSSRVQKFTVLLVTALAASQDANEVQQLAAEVLCRQLQRELTGARATDADFRRAAKLGEAVAAGQFTPLANLPPSAPVLQQYPSS